MTRFEQELSGSLGAFWKKHAEEEIRKMEERQMNGEIFFGADGVVRWAKVNRVMNAECRQIIAHTAYRDLFSEEASAKAEKEANKAFFEAYAKREANRQRSDEELSEMRAAFGTGTTVVNVITGQRISL